MSPSQAGVCVGGEVAGRDTGQSPPDTQRSGLAGRPGWEMGIRGPPGDGETGRKWGEPRHLLPSENEGWAHCLLASGRSKDSLLKVEEGEADAVLDENSEVLCFHHDRPVWAQKEGAGEQGALPPGDIAQRAGGQGLPGSEGQRMGGGQVG